MCQFLRLERYFVIVTILVELRICITGTVTNPRLVVSHAPMMASNDAFRQMRSLSERQITSQKSACRKLRSLADDGLYGNCGIKLTHYLQQTGRFRGPTNHSLDYS